MLNFYGMDFSYHDHPNQYSLILYTAKCNLRCYGCHNRTLAGWDYYSKDIKEVKVEDYYNPLSENELNLSIKEGLLDMIILCGGEVLIHPIEDIINTIDYIKKLNPNVLIRIDTNGSFPEKTKQLKDSEKIDGFAIDIKGPYWNNGYYESISNIIGLPQKQTEKLSKNIVESIHYADELPYTIYRTVKYPIIDDENYFKEIKNYTKNNITKPHYYNEFVSL